MAARRLKVTESSSDPQSAFLRALDALGDDPTLVRLDVDEEFVPTGSIIWDHVLQLRGIPNGGRVIQIHGKEHGGKSTLCYSICKSYQIATGQPACIFDFEGTATGEYLRKNKVDTARDKLVLFKNCSIEAAVQKSLLMMQAGVKLFVYDSVPRMKSMVDEKEIMNGGAFKSKIGSHARVMGDFFDLILPYAQRYNCTIIMVNQIRSRIDGSREGQQAAKYSTITNLNYVLPGGFVMRFVPSLTIEVNVGKAIRAGGGDEKVNGPWDIEPGENKGDVYVATKIKIRVLKNKVTMGGYRGHHLYLRPGIGIDDNISIRELAHHYKLINYDKSLRKWVVGTSENPIIMYDTKDEAVRDLVIDQNPAVLARLRVLVVQAIEADQDGFITEPSVDELSAVDSEFGEPVRTTTVEFDDEEFT